MDKSLQQALTFFEQYNALFDSGDMNEFAKLFAEPFVSVRGDGSIQSMPTNQSAAAFFETVLSVWQAEGYHTFSTRDFTITTIGDAAMLVTLTWDMLDKNQTLIKSWRQSYNLIKQNDGWKVYASTFHLTA